MIAHLKDRAAALAALGWTGADAEWLAFVCLQSGAFLRSQYLRYVGESHPMHARRFVQRCRSIAVEVPWNGSAFLVCRIVARPVYRALGVEPLRHRPNATQALLARRLLAFDYVLEHRDRPWLPTEDDKVTALTAVGVPAAVLPQRVYAGRQGRGRTRYFVKTLPVALDATGSVFVYVQAGDAARLAKHGGPQAALDRYAELEGVGGARPLKGDAPHGTPCIESWSVWRSQRVQRD